MTALCQLSWWSSWLPLYHFISQGELAAVISVNFSLSFHKSSRRHSQQRILPLFALGFRWARSSAVENPGPTQICLCSKTSTESHLLSTVSLHPNSLRSPDKKHWYVWWLHVKTVPKPGNPVKALAPSRRDVHTWKCDTLWKRDYWTKSSVSFLLFSGCGLYV